MDIQTFIEDWLKCSNAYDTAGYLNMYAKKAVLDDPSVGKKFEGHAGIQQYFEDYFIGYKTKTRLVKLEVQSADNAHLEVEFTGNFPEGRIGGIFDFVFKNNKIIFVKAALL